MKLWKGAGAYVEGRSHIKKGIPCQDRASFCSKKGIYTISLADGAGSCKYSHEGAEILVKNIGHILSDNFDRLYKLPDKTSAEIIVSSLIKDLEIRAEELKAGVKDLSSTFMFVAVKKKRYLAGHIGDGMIGYMSGERMEILSLPYNEEFINVTHFITSSKSIENFRVFKGNIKNTDGFILMSDGSAFSLYDKRKKEIMPVAMKILNWLNKYPSGEVTETLKKNIENTIRQKTDDDCSIAIMKHVKMSISDIAGMEYEEQSKILGTKNKVHIKNKLKILEYFCNINNIPELTGLSKRTVKKHIKDFIEKKIIEIL